MTVNIFGFWTIGWLNLQFEQFEFEKITLSYGELKRTVSLFPYILQTERLID